MHSFCTSVTRAHLDLTRLNAASNASTMPSTCLMGLPRSHCLHRIQVIGCLQQKPFVSLYNHTRKALWNPPAASVKFSFCDFDAPHNRASTLPLVQCSMHSEQAPHRQKFQSLHCLTNCCQNHSRHPENPSQRCLLSRCQNQLFPNH